MKDGFCSNSRYRSGREPPEPARTNHPINKPNQTKPNMPTSVRGRTKRQTYALSKAQKSGCIATETTSYLDLLHGCPSWYRTSAPVRHMSKQVPENRMPQRRHIIRRTLCENRSRSFTLVTTATSASAVGRKTSELISATPQVAPRRMTRLSEASDRPLFTNASTPMPPVAEQAGTHSTFAPSSRYLRTQPFIVPQQPVRIDHPEALIVPSPCSSTAGDVHPKADPPTRRKPFAGDSTGEERHYCGGTWYTRLPT